MTRQYLKDPFFFYKSLQSGNLNIPKPKFLSNDSTIEMPFMFVADEASGLSETVLRSYAGRMLPPKNESSNIVSYEQGGT